VEVFGSEPTSPADLPQFEQRYDVSRREHEVKSRTGIRRLSDPSTDGLMDTCATRYACLSSWYSRINI